MKKVLVVVFAVVIGFSAVSASAQTPYLQIYFDELYTQTTADCPAAPVGTVLGTAYVVGHNWNMYMNAVDYKIIYPPEVSWIGDNVASGALVLGTSPEGIAVAWTLPVPAFGPVFIQEISFLWMCDGCQVSNIYWPIVNYYEAADVVPGDLDLLDRVVTSIRWPDEATVLGVGLNAVICPNVPVEDSTWGGIKALYDE